MSVTFYRTKPEGAKDPQPEGAHVYDRWYADNQAVPLGVSGQVMNVEAGQLITMSPTIPPTPPVEQDVTYHTAPGGPAMLIAAVRQQQDFEDGGDTDDDAGEGQPGDGAGGDVFPIAT